MVLSPGKRLNSPVNMAEVVEASRILTSGISERVKRVCRMLSISFLRLRQYSGQADGLDFGGGKLLVPLEQIGVERQDQKRDEGRKNNEKQSGVQSGKEAQSHCSPSKTEACWPIEETACKYTYRCHRKMSAEIPQSIKKKSRRQNSFIFCVHLPIPLWNGGMRPTS